MSTPSRANEVFKLYGIENALSISDPDRFLYKDFALANGMRSQLIGLCGLTRAVQAMFSKHRQSTVEGDFRQLPGMFLLESGKITREYRHKYAGERPNYLTFVER